MSFDYRNKIFIRLQQRNASQSDSFRAIIQQNQELLQQNKELRAKSEDFEVQNQVLKLAQSRLTDDLAKKEGGQASEELVKKCEKLEKELMESWRLNTENAGLVMDTARKIQEAEALLAKKGNELIEITKKYEELSEQKKDKDEVLVEVQKENSAIKHQYKRVQEQMAKISHEHDDLVSRWMQLKQNEAKRMNEINEMYAKAVEGKKKMESEAAGKRVTDTASTDLSEFIKAKPKSDLPSGAKRIVPGHRGTINSISYNNSGSILVSGSQDKLVKLWNVRSFQAQATFSGPVQSIMCVKFSPNDEFVLGASNDHSLRLWGAQDGRVRHTLTGHLKPVMAASFAEDSKKIVSGSHDRTLKLWDIIRGFCIRTIFCQSSCNDVDFTTLTNMIVSGHIDYSLRFWDIRSGDMVQECQKIHSGKVTSVDLSPDSRSILTCSRDGTLKQIDIRTYGVLKTYSHNEFRVGADWAKARYSSDGRYAMAGSDDGQIFIWDCAGGRVVKRLKDAHKDTVISVSWNPLGNQIASCDRSGNVVFWE
mmetsp:Transcript_33610/g.45989  ORF Transcript_33610/g.45989 Transcript_33610/m.45989 type:complete len:535 (-) Transcript_33610:128-1732(-)|eukprot:CAMPEP_0201489416 /NCGR_PEP_ID=MMETSP0151_2-20130828/22772_1 /ASSEMBLY_ACC=CAM_ASM_000257 /TAXON_ID=200890 /ORGANISM="Paramoeba atlantica, Strain 621/1 / CCAP 1560/9" /LENGTH=534 /DNA_ID=CAMNT_0047875015 /DNA_START=36 /DNA_END=1640 /DNA_ORIENTATION=+